MSDSRVILSVLKGVVIMGMFGTLVAQQPAPEQGARGAGGRGGGGQAPAGAAPAARGAAPTGRGAAPGRMPLFFKEEWSNPTNLEHPLGQDSVGNPNLELKVYGPSAKELLIAGSATNESNPPHPWTGMCTTPCGLTLRDKTRFVDLTGLARIKWVTKMSGLHQVRPIVKLANGTLLVGDLADGSITDWQEREFSLSGIRWFTLDPERAVTTGNPVVNPDLSRVDEVGFVDLMPGSGHGPGGWSDVAKIEVYGRPVPRQ
jgi:hypothetical protein